MTYSKNQPGNLHYLAVMLLPACLGLSAGAEAESRVIKCTTPSGRVLFSQTGCSEGVRERLHIQNPRIGWVKPPQERKTPASHSKERRERREVPRTTAVASSSRQQQRCWRTGKKIGRIERELKRGYKLRRGIELRDQLAESEEYLERFCD